MTDLDIQVLSFFGLFIWGMIAYIALIFQKAYERGGKHEDIWHVLAISMWTLTATPFIAGVLWVLYWIWYYLCGGFLLFETSAGFWGTIMDFIMSMFCLVLVVTFIAAVFKWIGLIK